VLFRFYLSWDLFGKGLENLGRNHQAVELPLRAPNSDELLLRVDALGLCFSDTKLIWAGNEHARIQGRDLEKDPTVAGHEAALTVVKVGKNWKNKFNVGERYIIQADIFIDGEQKAFGYVQRGAMAQYAYVGPWVLDGDDIRQELVDTITEYNKTKVEFRKRVKELADTKDELEKTAAELATMKPKVEAAEKAAKEASDRATDMEAQKNRADDKIRELEIDLKKRDDEIKKLRSMQGQAQPEAGTQVVQFNFTPGQKGKVIAVNEKWNYALIELDEAFLKEAMGDDLTQPAKPAPNTIAALTPFSEHSPKAS